MGKKKHVNQSGKSNKIDNTAASNKQGKEESNFILNFILKASQAVMIIFLVSKFVLLCYQIFAYCDMQGVNISVKVIDDLAHGNNPYGTAWLYDAESMPAPYYESGFFHVLPAALFAMLPFVSATLAAGITQLIYVVLGLLVMYLCVKEFTGDTTLALFSTTIFHECVRAHLVDCFRPDTLCALLIITILWLLMKDEKRTCDIQSEHPTGAEKDNFINSLYKKADKKANIYEWIIAVCLVLLLFLKIHYATIIVAVFALACKKKRWLPWGLKVVACGVAITIMTQLCFPTFFSTFGIRVIEMMRDNNADSDLKYMFQQWGTLLKQFWPFFAIILIGCVTEFKNYKSLWQNNIYFVVTINILVNIAALCYMGKWNGNYINYHYIMIMSSIILTAMFFLHTFVKRLNEKNLVVYGLILGFVLATTLRSEISLVGTLITYPEKKASFQEEYAFLDGYRSEDMLLEPSLAYYTYANDIYQWDYMDQIYIPYDIGTSPRWNFLFPYTNLYRQRCIEYGEVMVQKIKDQKYSIIVESDTHILGLKIGLENEFQDAIHSNYEEKQWNDIKYWVPKR